MGAGCRGGLQTWPRVGGEEKCCSILGGRAVGGRSPTGGSQASAGLRLPALPAPVCFSYFRGGLEKSATP